MVYVERTDGGRVVVVVMSANEALEVGAGGPKFSVV